MSIHVAHVAGVAHPAASRARSQRVPPVLLLLLALGCPTKRAELCLRCKASANQVYLLQSTLQTSRAARCLISPKPWAMRRNASCTTTAADFLLTRVRRVAKQGLVGLCGASERINGPFGWSPIGPSGAGRGRFRLRCCLWAIAADILPLLVGQVWLPGQAQPPLGAIGHPKQTDCEKRVGRAGSRLCKEVVRRWQRAKRKWFSQTPKACRSGWAEAGACS